MQITSLTVSSDTTEGVEYTIDLDPSGEVRCSCPAARYAPRGVCKHVAFVYGQIVQDGVHGHLRVIQ